MATLPQVLDALTSIPAQIETKMTFLPKLSAQLRKIDAKLPAGPNILPAMMTKTPTLPNIPSPFKGVTSVAVIPIPGNYPLAMIPGGVPPPSGRGALTYAGAPGSARGTLTYTGE